MAKAKEFEDYARECQQMEIGTKPIPISVVTAVTNSALNAAFVFPSRRIEISDREVRANFAELGQQWRDLARQHQYLANPLPESNSPTAPLQSLRQTPFQPVTVALLKPLNVFAIQRLFTNLHPRP